jgi:hypothetical protein
MRRPPSQAPLLASFHFEIVSARLLPLEPQVGAPAEMLALMPGVQAVVEVTRFFLLRSALFDQKSHDGLSFPTTRHHQLSECCVHHFQR